MGNLRCIILFSVCMFVYQTLADEEISSGKISILNGNRNSTHLVHLIATRNLLWGNKFK